MLSIERVRGLLPVANIKGIVLNAPDAINDSVNIGTTIFFSKLGETLDIRVKTTSITTADNKTSSTDNLAFASIPELNFNDHLRLCVIQSRSSDLTGVLKSMGADIIKYIGPLNQWRGNRKFNDMISSNILSKLNIPKDQLSVFKRNFMDVQTKKLFENIDSPLLEKTDGSGLPIKSIPLNFDFTIDQFNPAHLSYFVIPYLDLESLAASVETVNGTPEKEGDFVSLGLNASDFEMLGRISTPLKYDTVFDGGQRSGDSFFYKTKAGKVWTGAIHKMSDGKIMTGNGHSVGSKYLTTVRTKNVKIQDFRVRKGITNIEVMDDFQDESTTVRNIISKFQPKNRSLNPNNNVKDSYISDLFISTGSRKSSKFMFLINMDDLISHNSLFGKLIRTGDLTLRDKVFDRSAIKSLKIYRQTVRKVVGTNTLGNATEKYLEMDEAPVLIASTFQKGTKKTVEAVSNLGEENNMSFSDVGIRAFSVTDRNFTGADTSQYQYRVEIQVVDKTLKYLREEVGKLRNFVNTLENFQSDILNSTIRPKQDTDNPYIKDKARSLARNRSIGGYDFRFGNLTPNFAAKMRNKYNGALKSGIESFIELLQIFSDDKNFTVKQQTNLDNYLNMMTSPNVTNPTNVGSTIQLVQDAIGKMSNYIGENVRKTDPVENKANYVVGFGESVFATHGAIKIEKRFKNILDLSMHGKGAYDYLSVDIGQNEEDSSTQIGLRLLGGKEYRGRVVREILKFFTNTQPDLTQGLSGQRTKYAGGDSVQNTGFSFFSPSVIRFNEMAIDTLNADQVENPLLMKFVESKLISNKTISDQNGEVPAYDAAFRTNTFLAAQNNVDAAQLAPTEQRYYLADNYSLLPTSPKVIPLSEAKIPGAAPPPPVESESDSSAGSAMNLPSMYPSSFFERIFKRAINKEVEGSAVAQQQNISLFDLDQNVNFLKGLEQSKVANLPNQLKALFISITSGNGNDTLFRAQTRKDVFNDPDYAASATLKYKLITEVQYLNGFSTTSMDNRKKLLVTAPKFSRLTADAFSTFTGKKVLCRLRKYEIPEWGITRPRLLDTLIYDEYFIIQPDTPIAGANPELPAGIGAAVAAAGWGLSEEEYALLAEFGTSFLPHVAPYLKSDEMKNLAGQLQGFATKMDSNPVTEALEIPGTQYTDLADLRRQLQEINVLIAGVKSEIAAKNASMSTYENQLATAQTSLNGSTDEQRDSLLAQIHEFNGTLAAMTVSVGESQSKLADLEDQRNNILLQIKTETTRINTSLYETSVLDGEDCPLPFQQEGSAGMPDPGSHSGDPPPPPDVTGDTITQEQIGEFNRLKSFMSEEDAAEFDLLLAELEALGPDGVQQANEMRQDAVTMFNTSMEICEEARGRQAVRSYIDNREGAFKSEIDQKVAELANGLVSWQKSHPEIRIGGQDAMGTFYWENFEEDLLESLNWDAAISWDADLRTALTHPGANMQDNQDTADRINLAILVQAKALKWVRASFPFLGTTAIGENDNPSARLAAIIYLSAWEIAKPLSQAWLDGNPEEEESGGETSGETSGETAGTDSGQTTEGTKYQLREALLTSYSPSIQFGLSFPVEIYGKDEDAPTTETDSGQPIPFEPLEYVAKGFRQVGQGITNYAGVPYGGGSLGTPCLSVNAPAAIGGGGNREQWTAPVELGGITYSAANNNLTSDGWPWFMEGYRAPDKTVTKIFDDNAPGGGSFGSGNSVPITLTYVYFVGSPIWYVEEGGDTTIQDSGGDYGNISEGDDTDASDSSPNGDSDADQVEEEDEELIEDFSWRF